MDRLLTFDFTKDFFWKKGKNPFNKPKEINITIDWDNKDINIFTDFKRKERDKVIEVLEECLKIVKGGKK